MARYLSADHESRPTKCLFGPRGWGGILIAKPIGVRYIIYLPNFVSFANLHFESDATDVHLHSVVDVELPG